MVEIDQKEQGFSNLWKNLCKASHQAGNPFFIESTDFPMLRKLETLRLVVTTDMPKYLGIKIIGQEKDSDGNSTFCLNRRDHGKTQKV